MMFAGEKLEKGDADVKDDAGDVEKDADEVEDDASDLESAGP